MDQTEIANFTQALSQLGATLRSNAGAVGQSMARLRTEMQRGTGTIQSNAAALQRLMSDFEGLDEAARKSTAGQAMLAEQTRMASQVMRDASGQLSAGLLKGGLTEAIDYVSKQLFTSIGNYQEGASGIQAAFNNQNAAIESQIRVLERLSSGAALTAETLMLIPNPMARLGALAAGAVAGLADFAKGLSETQKQAFQVFQKEMVITGQSFDIMQKSGLLLQSGFSDARAVAGSLQLNMDELARTVSQNKKELSDFGGSVTGGVRRLKQVGDAFTRLASQGTDLRKDLEYAGYSQQEQTEGMIDYMDMLNRTGRLRGMSDEQIAKQGAEYLKNLKAISAYTGEDAKQAQARAQAASEQLAVQAKLRKSQDPQAMEKFQAMIKMMPKDMEKGMQQMVAFDGTVVDKNLNILFAQSPTRKRMLDEAYADLSSGLYTQEELQARQEKRMKANAKALEDEALAMGPSLGVANLATGQLGEVVTMAQNQVKESQKGQASLIDQLGTTTEQMKMFSQQVDATGKAIDPLRESAIRASRAMREDLPSFIQATGNAMNEYIQNTFAKQGVDGMAKAIQAANKEAIKLIQEGAKAVASDTTKPVLGPGGRVAEAISGAVDYLIEATKKLSSASGNLLRATERLPGRAGGTPGTGKLIEDFGSGQLLIGHGREGMFTEDQLLNLVKGVNSSGIVSGMQAMAEKNSANFSAMYEKLATSVVQEPKTEINVAAPTPQSDNFQNIGNQLKDSFTQSMAAFQQQKLQITNPVTDETESKILVETIQEAFAGQNGFNQMLSNLKGQLETDSGQQIAVLKEQVTKLEDLLSAMQDNVDYSKRIADNIA